jgi:hypothetical protein
MSSIDRPYWERLSDRPVCFVPLAHLAHVITSGVSPGRLERVRQGRRDHVALPPIKLLTNPPHPLVRELGDTHIPALFSGNWFARAIAEANEISRGHDYAR